MLTLFNVTTAFNLNTAFNANTASNVNTAFDINCVNAHCDPPRFPKHQPFSHFVIFFCVSSPPHK